MKNTNLMKAARTLAMIELSCPAMYRLMVNSIGHIEDRCTRATEAAKEVDDMFGLPIRQAVEAMLNTGCLNLGFYEDKVKRIINKKEGYKYIVDSDMPGYYRTFKAASERAGRNYLGGCGVCSAVKYAVRGVKFGKEAKYLESKVSCERLHNYLRTKFGVKGLE